MSLICAALMTLAAMQVTKSLSVSDLDLSTIKQGWGKAVKDRSVTDTPLSIGGRPFSKGVGTHAKSVFKIRLDGRAVRFHAWCGVDDNARSERASVVLRVLGDGNVLWQSPRMTWKQAAVQVDVPLKNVKILTLEGGDGGDGIDYDHVDWADATITYSGKVPLAFVPPLERPIILTPPAPPTPRINGPSVYGARPGHPFLYQVPATGRRPMRFSAKGLPKGLSINPENGQISGRIEKPGTYPVKISASNRLGLATRTLRIVAGGEIALTPQMGWNSWYVWLGHVSDKIMRASADAMVSTGLVNHGWQYVDIDDCWARVPGSKDPVNGGPTRDASGNLLPNAKFPDMKALTDYIHSKGLKAGIYTSPGPTTCAGFEGAFRHEEQDAKTFADWGFDLLKYDWCSYKAEAPGVEGLKKPYALMGSLLKQQDRDIVLNLCQYGMGEVWKWGKEVGGQSWRTADDLGNGYNLFRDSFALYDRQHLESYSGPGAFNDPDYLLLGQVAGPNGTTQPTQFTPNEQYTQVSMWCLLAAPLILSGDITHLDPFTLSLLTNDEVLAIDQDSLVKAARKVSQVGETQVWARPLEDGGTAVGLFNLGDDEATVNAMWADVGLKGRHKVRDLWRQKDVGTYSERFSAKVPRHGVVLVKLTSAASSGRARRRPTG